MKLKSYRCLFCGTVRNFRADDDEKDECFYPCRAYAWVEAAPEQDKEEGR
jgi:hypothetical protein